MQNSLIRSDWVVEGEVPWLVFVTHSGSETKNTQKFWRDCAELLQALRATRGKLFSVGVVFDAHLLKQLVDAEAALLHSLVLAEQINDVAPLLSLTDATISKINAKKNDDFAVILTRLDRHTSGVLHNAVVALASRFNELNSMSTNRPPMAHLLREQRVINDDILEPTQFYSGCAALMLVEGASRLELLNDAAANRIPTQLPAYFAELGGAESIGGKRPAAPLRWLATKMPREVVVAALNGEETAKAPTYRAMLRSAELLPAWEVWIRRNGRDAKSVLRLMNDSFRDPSSAAQKTLGCSKEEAPTFNWAWTFFVTTMRELQQRKQAFGASKVADITGNRRLCVQNSILSDFECGTRSLESNDLLALSQYFAQQIQDGELLDPLLLRSRLLHEVFVDKIGPHSVHPIPALIREVARRSGLELESVWFTTSIGAMAGATGNAARVRILKNRGQMIWWRSAFDGNEAHKAKEVGARIFGMTTDWGEKNGQLSRSTGRRFTLIVDGDFSPEHLGFFEACGADILLRPQMILEQLPGLLGG